MTHGQTPYLCSTVVIVDQSGPLKHTICAILCILLESYFFVLLDLYYYFLPQIVFCYTVV